ncbi:hypothetical protein HDU67_008584 [Dinochytrium kinnereticum]|nr:hypothetical protein HDU67_008584 [Dinochytrium kinnereticum]
MSLSGLPLELHQRILGILEFTDLLKLRTTSRFFYELVSNGEPERMFSFGTFSDLESRKHHIAVVFLSKLWRNSHETRRLRTEIGNMLVTVDLTGSDGAASCKARVFLSAIMDGTRKTVKILSKSRISLFEKDIDAAADIISNCDPLEVRVLPTLSSETPYRATSPTYELYPNSQTLKRILASGDSLDFLADGTIGFSPEFDKDRYLYSEPPHDISAAINRSASAIEIIGSERGHVLVTGVEEGGDFEAAIRDLSSYFKMLGRRWGDLNTKAIRAHARARAWPTPPHD